jgi:hypothetical protein
MPFPSPSLSVWIGIPALSAVVAAFVVFGFWRTADSGRRGSVLLWSAAGVGGYFAVSGLLAATGVLAHVGKGPPPLLAMMAVLSVTTVLVALGRASARFAEGLPLWALVGFQAFRLPLELVLWRAAEDGTMPIQMSFEGRNFDIVSGATALLLAVAQRRKQLSSRVVLALCRIPI